MAIQSLELCVVRGDNQTLNFTVGDISDATFVVQLRPGTDLIRKNLSSAEVTLSGTTLSVDINPTDFDSLAETALTVARYSLITQDDVGNLLTAQVGVMKIFLHPR